MTVSSATPYVSYNGDGSTTAFSVTFPFYEIVVTHISSTGTETQWTEGNQYTVSGGAGTTGTVTTTGGNTVASGASLHIRRVTTRTQAIDFINNDAFDEDSLEEGLDRAVMIMQEMRTLFDGLFDYNNRYQLETVQMKALAAAPASPATGMLAMSDGTTSGTFGASGAGLYRYTGTAWTLVG